MPASTPPAPSQPPNGTINQVALSYLETAVASVTVLLVLTFRSRAAYGIALLVALSALGAVVLYRIAEAISVIAALIGISAHPSPINPPAAHVDPRLSVPANGCRDRIRANVTDRTEPLAGVAANTSAGGQELPGSAGWHPRKEQA